ncbi:hypothetical protein [Cupriavidus sp. CuC1]|uniref:hypothetical protein n=1 Tax=Cupriavidus sp. CuC1 TaxID=3373131 RepID=UPI0037D86BBA
MLVFLDTEFTDFIECELISLGLVAEDGTQFYAEVQDFDREKCNQFVRAAVWSVLGQIEGASVARAALPARLCAWFASLPDSVTVAADSFTDWELLLDVLDGERPPNLAGRYDLRELASNAAFQQAVATYHGQPGHPWHHALHDAMALRAGWLAVNAATGIAPPQAEERSLALHRRVAEKLRAWSRLIFILI